MGRDKVTAEVGGVGVVGVLSIVFDCYVVFTLLLR